MSVFFDLLADNVVYIYALCALVALYLLRVAARARRERRSAIFPLEREVAVGRTYRTLGLAVLVLLIIGATWAATEYLFPRFVTTEASTSPVPDDVIILIDTPTVTPLPPTATPTTAPTPQVRPTRPPAPTPILVPVDTPTPVPVIVRPACANPNVDISSPGIGQIISGDVAVTGTANIANFQFYKLEWAWEGNPSEWNWFAGGESPVVGGYLGAFAPAGLPSGSYNLRLVVVDATGNYPTPCNVRVTVP